MSSTTARPLMRMDVHDDIHRPGDPPWQSTRNLISVLNARSVLPCLTRIRIFGIGVKTAVNDTITKNKVKHPAGLPAECNKMGESDFSTLLTNIKATNPDAVYLQQQLPIRVPRSFPRQRRDVGLNTIFLNVENKLCPRNFIKE